MVVAADRFGTQKRASGWCELAQIGRSEKNANALAFFVPCLSFLVNGGQKVALGAGGLFWQKPLQINLPLSLGKDRSHTPTNQSGSCGLRQYLAY